MDIKLESDDIDVSTGDLVLVTGTDAIRQHITIRLRFFLREWFLDQRVGVPYYEEVLIKNPSAQVVTSIFREVVAETPGVLEVNDLELSYEGTTRILSVSFSARVTDSEAPLNYESDFIIGGS